MATNESSNTTPAPQMTPAELSALASRLRNRAESVVLRDCPHQQTDLLAAANVIDQLVQLHADIRAAEAAADRLHSLLKLAGGR
jgi:hypothetical protein